MSVNLMRMKTISLVSLLALAVVAGESRAALENAVGPCPGSSSACLWKRPLLPPPPGWQRAEQASDHYQASAFVPAGSNFNSAPAVMYAKSVPAEGQALADFMADDLADFRRQYPGLHAQRGLTSVDGDGRSLPTIRLSPSAGGKAQWETIAYGQEGGDFLVFALSARDQAAHDAALAAFAQMLRGYHAVAPAVPARH
jgi:hypothetical protein